MASYLNRLDETILTDATLYSSIEKHEKYGATIYAYHECQLNLRNIFITSPNY